MLIKLARIYLLRLVLIYVIYLLSNIEPFIFTGKYRSCKVSVELFSSLV